MTTPLSVADIASYLAATGWVRQLEEWRGASIWVHGDDYQVLVPGNDGFGDGPRRVRDILRALERLEERPQEEISSDIDAPMADVQWYRATVVPHEGQVGLTDAVTALNGAHSVLTAVARAALDGPRAVFEGVAPKEVRDLLARVRVGPIMPSADLLTVRLPLDPAEPGGEPPLARRALLLFQRATLLLREAADSARATGEMAVFDDLVRDGVSADLCLALARFAGSDPGTGFEVGFRWARTLPAGTPPRTVAFDDGTGPLLRQVGYRLRRLRRTDADADVTVIGTIGMLFDNGRADRFRVNVHGVATLGTGETRRSLWVRLPDEAAYDLAVEAHREGARVHARGTLTDLQGRLELAADSFGKATDSFGKATDDPPERGRR